MSREWTVRAQLTISQPTGTQSSSSATARNENGYGSVGAIADGSQNAEKPVTIVYEWTTAAEHDPDAATEEQNAARQRGKEVDEGVRPIVIMETKSGVYRALLL